MADQKITKQEALDLHSSGRAGKLQISPTKPLATSRDLSLAYSPGVAYPCLEIQEDEDKAYDYTAKSNTVAVISNGTAVLGLGNLGALASKPVMEGKAVLFKRFADIDGIDIEVDSEDPEVVINTVKAIASSFGGINLEDIKAPEAFIIEERLKELCDVPVFHDDQHGTAIIAIAGLINAVDLTGRDLKTIRIVVNGAGAAGISCLELAKFMGVPHENVLLCDSRGVIHKGRTAGMNPWKEKHAVQTDCRTLEEAMKGADVFFGLSVKGAVTKEMVASMAKNPIIFAMANPDPEIRPEDVAEVRSDAIMATGRSDYPNQVNNVLGFPYIFRGALDVRATSINQEMKIAAARAIANLARMDVPPDVSRAYEGRTLVYGPKYIIPVPFDRRLMVEVPKAVALAAVESGVARRGIDDLDAYEHELSARLDPTINATAVIHGAVKSKKKRVVFAEGEQKRVIQAASGYYNAGLGKPILIGRPELVLEKMKELGIDPSVADVISARETPEKNEQYIASLYKRLQREGLLERDCKRMVHQNRNIYAASMICHGDADAMVTGLTRSFSASYRDVTRVIPRREGATVFGLSIIVLPHSTLFLADTSINSHPSGEALANIAIQTAKKAESMGHTPRVAFLSYSNFKSPRTRAAKEVEIALDILDRSGINFEYEGEMMADIALDHDLMQRHYPFSRLTGPANILIMPNLYAANISAKLLRKGAGAPAFGPIVMGLEKPANIVPLAADTSDLINAASFAAHDSILHED